VNFSSDGSTSFSVNASEVIISFLTVLMPMLAKRIMKMTMTAAEIIPPVVVV